MHIADRAPAPVPLHALALEQLALTMGDPCGIGPEIIVKALRDVPPAAQPLVVGDTTRLAQAAALCGVPMPRHVLQVGADTGALPWGQVQAAAGEAAYRYIEQAVRLARDGRVRGIVTAPIHKAALNAAGHAGPGHTEILCALSGAPHVAMMLANDELRVVLVTIHCALRDAIAQVTPAHEHAAITLAHAALTELGVAQPRVAVAGLNPHAGEGGLLGDEERDVIAPAIACARADGIDASGPWPGDTVFMQARGALYDSAAGLRSSGRFDVVVAQYHDQGLIPVKYLGLDLGVNITLGLPFVRTSPDHGTAFDIAGRGVAREHSLATALRYAVQLCTARAAAAAR